jgi:hypothetical protein
MLRPTVRVGRNEQSSLDLEDERPGVPLLSLSRLSVFAFISDSPFALPLTVCRGCYCWPTRCCSFHVRANSPLVSVDFWSVGGFGGWNKGSRPKDVHVHRSQP